MKCHLKFQNQPNKTHQNYKNQFCRLRIHVWFCVSMGGVMRNVMSFLGFQSKKERERSGVKIERNRISKSQFISLSLTFIKFGLKRSCLFTRLVYHRDYVHGYILKWVNLQIRGPLSVCMR